MCSSCKGGTFPTRLQGTRDLLKYFYLRIHVIQLIRFLYLTSYFAPIFYAEFWYSCFESWRQTVSSFLVCLLQRYVELFHPKALLYSVPPSALSSANNLRVYGVKLWIKTAHLGRTDGWKQFGICRGKDLHLEKGKGKCLPTAYTENKTHTGHAVCRVFVWSSDAWTPSQEVSPGLTMPILVLEFVFLSPHTITSRQRQLLFAGKEDLVSQR